MIEKINYAEDLKNQWKEEGRTSYLDSPENIRAIEEMNIAMQEVRREYKIKEANSEASAAKIILTR